MPKADLRLIEFKAFTKELIILTTTLPPKQINGLKFIPLWKLMTFWMLAIWKRVSTKSTGIWQKTVKIKSHLQRIRTMSEALRQCLKKMEWTLPLWSKGFWNSRKDSPSRGKRAKGKLKFKMTNLFLIMSWILMNSTILSNWWTRRSNNHRKSSKTNPAKTSNPVKRSHNLSQENTATATLCPALNYKHQ